MDVELTLRGISAAYGKHTVLEAVDVDTLQGGQLVGLLGPNASGKTTLIKSLAGVHRGYKGEVDFLVDGESPRGKHRRQLIGYVPQDLPSTAALRAFETVLIAARREACEDPITRSGEVLQAMGLDAIASRYLNELSGGQRQLVAVAQMLVGNPWTSRRLRSICIASSSSSRRCARRLGARAAWGWWPFTTSTWPRVCVTNWWCSNRAISAPRARLETCSRASWWKVSMG